MSHTISITLRCDGSESNGDDCVGKLETPCETIALAREYGQKSGWIRISEKDLCPLCAQKL